MCSHIASLIWFLGYARHEQTMNLEVDKLVAIFDTEAQEDSENDDNL